MPPVPPVVPPKSIQMLPGTRKYLTDGYYNINYGLRNGKITPTLADEINDVCSDIRYNGTDFSSVTLYRGVDERAPSVEIGDVLTDPGFLSKTSSLEIAARFTQFKPCCLWVMNYLTPSRHFFTNTRESEFLTYPGESFQLISKDSSKTPVEMHFVSVPHPPPPPFVPNFFPDVVVLLELFTRITSRDAAIAMSRYETVALYRDSPQYLFDRVEEKFLRGEIFELWWAEGFATAREARSLEWTFKVGEGLITKSSKVLQLIYEIPRLAAIYADGVALNLPVLIWR